MTPPVLPGVQLFGAPQCHYCGGEGGDDQWMRLVWTPRGLLHDGCLGDLETDLAAQHEQEHRG